MNLIPIKSQSGSMLVESVLMLVGIVMPILITVISLAQVLEAQGRLDLITKEASRTFSLANSNQAGFQALAQLNSQRKIFGLPVDLEISCFQGCIAGSAYQVSGKYVTDVFSLPLLPDLRITLSSSVTSTIDKYIER